MKCTIKKQINKNNNKSSIYHNQVAFIPGKQGQFNIPKKKKINVIYIHHQNKGENHMIKSIDIEKATDNSQYTCMVKILYIIEIVEITST